jgi:ubiquinone/menaquinone biosynthesis C-methylase UbiE
MGALGADVVAIDISKESENIIRKAASKLAVENVKGGGGDFLDLAFQARSFDFIIGKAFLHHLTHDQEAEYLKKVAVLLKTDGAARFFEPATNSLVLDKVRWMVPVPGRPSMLSRTAFAEWKARDPHPQRDNSSKHYSQVGKIFFDAVDIVYIGSIERLCRVLPRGDFNRRFRRWAHKVEKRMPMRLRHIFARSQLVTYRNPRVPVVELA